MLSSGFQSAIANDMPSMKPNAHMSASAPTPRVLFFNHPLAVQLDIDTTALPLADFFSGNALPEGAQPVAQVYDGHQFGHFSPQLGDGRGLLLGEVVDRNGQRQDIAFKGSGPTAYSRSGDGKAAVGPMLREVLISEALHALGIPTTRSLAVVATGERVYRDEVLPGAILTRVAASHIQVGTFEYFAARGDNEQVRRLADYTIARHDPTLAQEPDRYLKFLRAMSRRQAALIAQWMNVGFIHGVMNTDNMAISGETIDYGPCALLDAYDPKTVFSSIDRQGRYAYGRQPIIAQWNIARLAETLLPLTSDNEQKAIAMATGVLDEFPDHYQHYWLAGIRAKMGLQTTTAVSDQDDIALALDWLSLLQQHQVDFTQAWRYLADLVEGNSAPLRNLFTDRNAPDAWLERWQTRSAQAPSHPAPDQRARAMRTVNPRIIPRNHRVEEALAAASREGDLGPFNALLAALQRPYDDDPAHAPTDPAAASVTACYKTYCGT